eukprot:m.530264 g.530264  ORF g.530264 m.530264 type:complete len:112 (+) comp22027_c0_seq1:1371-1706(+)
MFSIEPHSLKVLHCLHMHCERHWVVHTGTTCCMGVAVGLSEEEGMAALMAKIQNRQESRDPFGGVLERYATEADLENDPLQDVVFNYGRKKSRKKGKGKQKKIGVTSSTPL